MKRNLSLLLGVLAVTAGCQKTESKTEIILEISTNIPVPAGMNSLSLKIVSQAKPEKPFSRTYALGTGVGQMMLPGRMTLVPTEKGTVLNLLVEGLLGTNTVVSRQVMTKFAEGESKLLVIELLQKCVGQVCPNNQTCTPIAFCADPTIDPATLPTFDPSKNPNTPALDADAGVSIDASSDQSAGDGKLNPDRVASDGQRDGVPNNSEAGLRTDAPANTDLGGTVGPGQDGPVIVDAPVVSNPDTGNAVDAPANTSEVTLAKKTKGVACGGSGECESGLLCIDGVCCEGKCDGLCMACNVPGKLGTCTPVPLNDPSNGDCPDDGIASCARNGRCNGQGGCMMVPEGVACTAETCPAGTSSHTRPGLCDGKGHCGPGQLQDCAPFLCNATTKTCNPTCTTNEDCLAPNQCIGGSCGQKGDGLPCSAPGECKSNVCAQGVCCAGPCSDLCKSCAVEGKVGTCTAVPAGKPDVQARCQDMGVNTCGTNGLCDGAGACQKYGDSLVCGNQCDPTSATFTTSTCSAGTCSPGPAQSCVPYSCDGSGCKKSCTVLADCAPGFVCGAGGLCVRPPEDCMNGVDDDGDGMVDCADPDCQPGFMCVPTVPPDFTGPVELYDGPEASLPSCGGSYPVDHLKGWGALQVPNNCNCRCGLGGVTCPLPALGFGKAGTCPALLASVAREDLNVCKAASASSLYDTAKIDIAEPSAKGTCSAAVDPAPPATWNTSARVCGVQASGGGGCDKDSICWPRPQPAFAPVACVIRAGNQICPANGYVKKLDYFDSSSLNDTRACNTAGCGCTGPTNVSCVASLDAFAKPALPTELICGKESLLSVAAPGCKSLLRSLDSIAYYRVRVPNPPYTGSCAPTGAGTLTGSCTPTGSPYTVCCMP